MAAIRRRVLSLAAKGCVPEHWHMRAYSDLGRKGAG